MIESSDNFLNDEEFAYLRKQAQLLNEKGINRSYYASMSAYTITNDINNGNETFSQIVNKVENFIKKFTQDIPILDASWFAFANVGYQVKEHADVRNNIEIENLQKMYKVFIFCHEVWNSSWGGQLVFSQHIVPNNKTPEGRVIPNSRYTKFIPEQSFDSIPNRCIIYTPDKRHLVKPINIKAKQQRIIFGLRFGKQD